MKTKTLVPGHKFAHKICFVNFKMNTLILCSQLWSVNRAPVTIFTVPSTIHSRAFSNVVKSNGYREGSVFKSEVQDSVSRMDGNEINCAERIQFTGCNTFIRSTANFGHTSLTNCLDVGSCEKFFLLRNFQVANLNECILTQINRNK